MCYGQKRGLRLHDADVRLRDFVFVILMNRVERMGYSDREISELMGLNSTAFGRYRRAERQIPIIGYISICRVLRISFSDVVREAETLAQQ